MQPNQETGLIILISCLILQILVHKPGLCVSPVILSSDKITLKNQINNLVNYGSFE